MNNLAILCFEMLAPLLPILTILYINNNNLYIINNNVHKLNKIRSIKSNYYYYY